MGFDLRETAKDHRFIACHRGVTGGNIPCNTMPAYEIALMQGADMIQTDWPGMRIDYLKKTGKYYR